jgi:hypothetical protein
VTLWELATSLSTAVLRVLLPPIALVSGFVIILRAEGLLLVPLFLVATSKARNIRDRSKIDTRRLIACGPVMFSATVAAVCSALLMLGAMPATRFEVAPLGGLLLAVAAGLLRPAVDRIGMDAR